MVKYTWKDKTLTAEQEAKILYEYHNNFSKSVLDILKDYNISDNTFYRRIMDYKEPRRGVVKKRKYSFDINRIMEDSIDKFYWLGFISADGAIVTNSLNIELKDIDRKHLENFNLFMKNENPIIDRVNNLNVSCSRATINSKELILYLQQYNIVQNKSKIFTIPENKIPNKYLFHYLRGLIDGDGSITFNRFNQITLYFCSGNEKCVYQVRDMLKIDNKISVGKDSTYRFQITGNKKAKNVLDKLYEDSTEFNRLERKYNVYKQTLSCYN